MHQVLLEQTHRFEDCASLYKSFDALRHKRFAFRRCGRLSHVLNVHHVNCSESDTILRLLLSDTQYQFQRTHTKNAKIVPVLRQSPPPMSYDKYLEHIDTTMGADTPIAFGLHPNAEIDFRTQQSDTMFKVCDEFSRRQ